MYGSFYKKILIFVILILINLKYIKRNYNGTNILDRIFNLGINSIMALKQKRASRVIRQWTNYFCKTCVSTIKKFGSDVPC